MLDPVGGGPDGERIQIKHVFEEMTALPPVRPREEVEHARIDLWVAERIGPSPLVHDDILVRCPYFLRWKTRVNRKHLPIPSAVLIPGEDVQGQVGVMGKRLKIKLTGSYAHIYLLACPVTVLNEEMKIPRFLGKTEDETDRETRVMTPSTVPDHGETFSHTESLLDHHERIHLRMDAMDNHLGRGSMLVCQ